MYYVHVCLQYVVCPDTDMPFEDYRLLLEIYIDLHGQGHVIGDQEGLVATFLFALRDWIQTFCHTEPKRVHRLGRSRHMRLPHRVSSNRSLYHPCYYTASNSVATNETRVRVMFCTTCTPRGLRIPSTSFVAHHH